MNLPNKLTILRCIMVPLIVIFMLPISSLGDNAWNEFVIHYGMWIAAVLFVLASITDFLDGTIARRHGLVTNFGKFLDPIADKVLVLSVFIAFVARGSVHALVPIVILFREFAVTGIRLLAIERGTVIAASKLGKLKTVTQIIALILLLLEALAWQDLPQFGQPLTWAANIMVTICVIMTLASGIDYFRKSLSLFKDL